MAKEWQHKYRNLKQKEFLKEFEGWNDLDFVNHILGLRAHIEELEGQKDADDNKGAEKGAQGALNEKDYRQEWSYPTKIHFLLYLQQKPLTSEELNGLLLKSDKHYKSYNSPRNNLSVSLGRAVKSGRIKRIKLPGIKNLLFALPEWLDKEGNLKNELKYLVNQFA